MATVTCGSSTDASPTEALALISSPCAPVARMPVTRVSAGPSTCRPRLHSSVDPSSLTDEGGVTPSVRQAGGSSSNTAFVAAKVTTTSSTGAFPGAVASSLRLSHHRAATAPSVPTSCGVSAVHSPTIS